jgi:hypothetical protein
VRAAARMRAARTAFMVMEQTIAQDGWEDSVVDPLIT